MAGFVELMSVIVQTEMASLTLDPSTETTTQLILSEIERAIPVLVAAASQEHASEVGQYTHLILSLIERIMDSVDNKEIHVNTLQILTSTLGGDAPCVVVLPCLVKIAIADGEERQREVNQLLTGLLMNFKLENVATSALRHP